MPTTLSRVCYNRKPTRWRCPVCSSRKANQEALKHHFDIHPKEVFRFCSRDSTCKAVFHKEQNWVKHDEWHSAGSGRKLDCTRYNTKHSSLRCPVCGSKKDRKALLTAHFNVSHPGKTLYFCETDPACKSVFHEEERWRKHQCWHLARSPWCEICQYTGNSTNDMQVHINKHEQVRESGSQGHVHG